jgi:gamma-glutamyltranspeptidase / glutathione hydrolase
MAVSPKKVRVAGGVVASVESHGANAGAEILSLGGNAADAAIAAAFAQGVSDPLRCGIGGGGGGLFYDASSKSIDSTFSVGRAPQKAHDRMFKPVGHWGTLFRVEAAKNQLGYEASIIPGFVRGMEQMFNAHGSGRVSWRQLIEPSIRLAYEGFEVYPFLAMMWDPPAAGSNDFIGVGRQTVMHTAESKRLFTREDGSFLQIGDILVQEDYGRTLERIAEQGADEFYEGETARLIAKDFEQNGGYLSLSDLQNYRPDVEETLESTYRHLRLVTEDAPSVGPTFLETVHVLEGWDLSSLGFNSAEYIDRLARALTHAFIDRAEHIGDPESVEVPMDRLLSREYANQIRESIDQAIADGSDRSAVIAALSGPSETTHVTVIDGDSNAAAITHSVGSASGVITPGLGFFHNNHMIQFDARPGKPNSIAGGKRPNAGGAPVFGFDGDELVLAMGSPAGGRKVSAMAQVLANIVDFGMPVDAAVARERIHAEDIPMELSVEPSFDPRVTVELARRGHSIVVESYGARVQAVTRDPSTNDLAGGSDPRGDRGLMSVPRSQG